MVEERRQQGGEGRNGKRDLEGAQRDGGLVVAGPALPPEIGIEARQREDPVAVDEGCLAKDEIPVCEGKRKETR